MKEQQGKRHWHFSGQVEAKLGKVQETCEDQKGWLQKCSIVSFHWQSQLPFEEQLGLAKVDMKRKSYSEMNERKLLQENENHEDPF